MAMSSPRLNLADHAGTDRRERRRLTSNHPSTFQTTKDQGPDAMTVAGGIQGLLVHEDEAEGTLELGQHIQGRGFEAEVRVAGEQCGDQCGVGGVATVQLAAELAGEGVAVSLIQ